MWGRVDVSRAAQAVRIRPGNPNAHYNLGLVSLDLRLKAEALRQERRRAALDERLARKPYRALHKDKIPDVGVGPR